MTYHTILEDLPTTIPGFSKHDPVNDHTTIVLNSRLNHEQNTETYLHEKEHIESGDFDCKGDVDRIESKNPHKPGG